MSGRLPPHCSRAPQMSGWRLIGLYLCFLLLTTLTAALAGIVATGQPLTSDFDARWAAWQERGRLHDRGFRRRLWIAVPTVVILAATAYTFLSR